MHAAAKAVGSLTVTALVDSVGPVGLGSLQDAFPDATDQDWVDAQAIDRAAFRPDGGWQLSFRCFLVEGPGSHVSLIDTGVGPASSPASTWAPVPGRLLDALREEGVTVDDVDLVVQTHLHSDHVGWAVTPDGDPVFPRARYVVQRVEVAALEEAGSPLVPYFVQPLRRTGQLHEITGEVRLIGGSGASARMVAIPTPGHTPGHQSVLVEDHGREVIITGDVLVHAVQLANPSIAYVYETDPEAARQSREDVLSRARARHAPLATAHLTPPFLALE